MKTCARLTLTIEYGTYDENKMPQEAFNHDSELPTYKAGAHAFLVDDISGQVNKIVKALEHPIIHDRILGSVPLLPAIERGDPIIMRGTLKL